MVTLRVFDREHGPGYSTMENGKQPEYYNQPADKDTVRTSVPSVPAMWHRVITLE